MKIGRAIWAGIIAVFLFSFPGYCQEKITPIKAVAGKTFVITLESNPTTGYQWQLAQPIDKKIIKFLTSEYQPPKAKLIGAGGKEIWSFKALTKGKTKIFFKYVRPWEKGVPPAKTKIFEVWIGRLGKTERKIFPIRNHLCGQAGISTLD